MVGETVRPAVPRGWNDTPSLQRAGREGLEGTRAVSAQAQSRASPASPSSSSVGAEEQGKKEVVITRPPPPGYELSVGKRSQSRKGDLTIQMLARLQVFT